MCVALRKTCTSTFPLGRMAELVSRNDMVGFPSSRSARSIVNLDVLLIEFR